MLFFRSRISQHRLRSRPHGRSLGLLAGFRGRAPGKGRERRRNAREKKGCEAEDEKMDGWEACFRLRR